MVFVKINNNFLLNDTSHIINMLLKPQKLATVGNNEMGLYFFHIASGNTQWQSQYGKQDSIKQKLKMELPCGSLTLFCVYS